jgi:hypothetical protein
MQRLIRVQLLKIHQENCVQSDINKRLVDFANGRLTEISMALGHSWKFNSFITGQDNWTKTAQYVLKYKEKWEGAVKKSDETDEKRESGEEIKM